MTGLNTSTHHTKALPMIEYENLATSNSAYMDELEAAASRVIRSGRYVLGPEVAAFESEFARFLGAKHCVGVGNGLDALILAIEALDLPVGSDIIVASNTYIATILAILRARHNPILVEPDIETFNVDPDRLGAALTSKVRAICVTHLFGKACRMDDICNFANQNGLKIIEDCAQSHGAKFSGRMTGTFGVAGCYSFYPTKNLGAMGDAGAVITNDDALADRLRHSRNYGSKQKYLNDYIGVNSRLDEIQAAVLRVKLRYLEETTKHKRALAEVYFKNLPAWLQQPRRRDEEYDVFHIFGVRTCDRDALRAWLFENGVKTEIHYPIPPHRQKALRGLLDGDYPLADLLHATELSMPISAGHSESDVLKVCETIRQFKVKDH